MLVPYADSDDDEPSQKDQTVKASTSTTVPRPVETTLQPARKRKVLPTLPGSYSDANPRDDPAQHQGRKRSRPFTEGDYNMHVFASVKVPTKLKETILAIAAAANDLCPDDVHCFLESDDSLHVSLTHPHPLRRSQLSAVRAELTDIVARHRPFRLSFAGGLSGYVNGKKYGGEGEGGRAFLAIRLAAGSAAVERVVDDIHPLLDKLHLQRYHDDPEFHASFAWCLSEGDSPFTQDLLDELSRQRGAALLQHQPKGGWQVDQLEIKIGKEVHAMPLAA